MTAMLSAIWHRRQLIDFLVESQLRSSVHRTWLGSLWYLLVPLANALTYYFLIVVVFGRGEAYAAGTFLTVLSGVLNYYVLVNAVTYGLPAVYSNESILLQLKIEPVVLIAAGFWKGLRVSAFGIGVFLAVWLVLAPHKSWAALAYPAIGLAWIAVSWLIVLTLGTMATFFRDLDRLMPIVLSLLMYLCPVIYTTAMVPAPILGIYELNPLTCIFAALQWSMLGGAPPSLRAASSLAVFVVAMLLVSGWCYAWARPRITKSF